jgi:triosephosphate isomerase
MSKLIIANWKSHKNLAEAGEWLTEFADSGVTGSADTLTVAIAPSFPLVSNVATFLQSLSLSKIKVAVQDISPFPPGAYTGAVAAPTLQGLGITYAILGHSERRKYFHETHQEVANKVDQALQAGIIPVVCVDDEYVTQQASAIRPDVLSECVVAYEDLESIGTGKNKDPDMVARVTAMIKEAFGPVKVLYGGSVSVSNIATYLEITDGVLVGTHSLVAQDFISLLRASL